MIWWQYLLLVNLYLLLFYGFYTVLLRRETFFQLNRVYLVASGLLSFIIPAIQANWVQSLFITQQVNQMIYSQPMVIYQFAPVAEDNRVTIGQIMGFVYATGIVLLTVRLIWQLLKLKQLIRQPQGMAFSFFKKINVNAELTGNDVILAHEEVHARQWHSADVLIMEAIMIINWFNPVVYFYRRAIKHIHEFIADKEVVHAGADKADYALLLLNHTLSAPAHGLASQFLNHSLLKQRIIMLQKNRSQRVKLLKYGLSAPLFALMLVLSSATVNKSKAIQAVNNTAEKVFDAPATETVTTTLAAANKAIDKAVDNITTQSLPKTDSVPANNEVFTEVEALPEFPGGIVAFSKFLADNIRYPKEMRDNKIEGRVFLTFVVETDGSISKINSLRDVGYGSAEEAIRVLKLSPKWIPGKQNGKLVRVQYNIPVLFSLKREQATTAQAVTPQYATVGTDKPATFAAVTATADQSSVLKEVDELPEYPGGQVAMSKYLGRNIRYPRVDRDNKVTGTVMVNFIVNEDGSISNAKAIQGPSQSLQDEAVRVVKNMSNWIPGKKDGKVVKVEFNVPVKFSLNDERPAPAESKPEVSNKTSIALNEINVVGFISGDKEPAQLVLLDGYEISHKAMEAIDPKKIQSINVLTGADAYKKHGERGKGGVVEITTKANAPAGKTASDFFTLGNSSINGDPALRPLIFIDGSERSYDQLKNLDPKEIESISVLKDATATKKYGTKAVNGVLEITTKKGAKAKKQN